MKLLVAVFLAIVSVHNANCAMSEAQMKSAMKLVRNVCQPKFKATSEQIDAMHSGDWNQDKAGQCYNWCILNTYKLITKENKFDWENGIKTLNNQAPESIRKTAVVSVEKCKDAVKTPTDKCAAGFEIAKCIYEEDPAHYFLP